MKLAASLLATLFVAASPVAAQRAPERLSLDEATRLAEQNSPEIRSLEGEDRVAVARQRQALGAFLPRLSTSLSLSGSANRRWMGSDPYGNPLPSEEAVESTSSTGSQSLDLSIPVFQRGRRAEIGAAGADRRAAGAEARLVVGRVRGEVARRYNEALRAERTIALEERLLASARERLDATRRLFRIAAQGMTEVLGAEVEEVRQEQAVEEARGAARKAKLLLGESMGMAGAEQAVLTSEPPAAFDPARLNVDSLVALSLQAHPAMERAASTLAAAERRAETARAQRWPTVDARVGLSRSIFGEQAAAVDILNPSTRTDRNLSLRFGVSLPLFDQFRGSLVAAQAGATRTRAREEARAVRLAVEREVRSALIDLESAHRAIQLADRAAKLSQDRLEMAREQYRMGGIPFIDLQAVADRSAQAEREALRARFSFANAVATLEEKAGVPVRP